MIVPFDCGQDVDVLARDISALLHPWWSGWKTDRRIFTTGDLELHKLSYVQAITNEGF